MTVFVLEGPDLAGKSTLAKQLSVHLEEGGGTVEIMHFGAPDSEATTMSLLLEYMNAINAAVSKTLADPNLHVIFDRLHIGEFIYGHEMRGGSLLSWRLIAVLDDLLDISGIRKMFVDAPDDVLMERFGSRGDDYIKQDNLLRLAHTYRDILLPLERTGSSQILQGWQHVLSGTPVFL